MSHAIKDMPAISHPELRMMPHESGDFLTQEIAEFAVENDKLLRKNRDRETDITTYLHKLTMEDGTQYLASTAQPSRRAKNAVDSIANIETTAWTTNLEGMNMRRQRKLAQLGIASAIVSVPQNIGHIGSLTRNAHGELAIHDHFAELYDNNPEHLITNGISRGAMTAYGVVDLAPQHGKEVVYSDHIVPCFPYGVDPETDFNAYLNMPANELTTLRAIAQIPLRAMLHYPKTFDWHPVDLLRQLQEVPTLLSGATGEHADTMPHDTFGYAEVYEGDIMSQGKRWEEKLQDRPNFIVRNVSGGGHGSCVGEGAYNDWFGRVSAVAEALKANPGIYKLGHAAMRQAASEFNPIFLKTNPNESLHVHPAARQSADMYAI